MQQITQFMTHHWVIVAAFVVVLILIFIEEMRSSAASGKRMTPQELTYCLNHDDGCVIDIRDASLFREGHIAGSKNIMLADIDQNMSRFGDKEKDIVIVAGSQAQKSQAFMNKLRKAGFTKIHQLNGGINAWKTENLPLVKGNK